jgi:DNA polymerase-3 subunit delta
VITLIHGPAELLRAEAVDAIRTSPEDDPALLDANTAILDGRKVSLGEIQGICDTLPFLASRRLVIVEGLLRRQAGGKKPPDVAKPGPDDEPSPAEAGPSTTRQLVEYLGMVPDTTELVLVEDELIGSGPVLRRLLELQQERRAKILVCAKPSKNDLPNWIRARAGRRKLSLDAAAVNDLAEYAGDDLRQLDQEITKLADYASGRTVTRADVRLLVAETRAASIFELVDALGMGETAKAERVMRRILDVDGEQPLGVLAMIARQYRLIIQAKALQVRAARPAEVARTLNVPDWTATKLLAQASRCTQGRLQRALEQVCEADEAIKTGRMSDREAMDLLLVQLAGA